MPGDSFVILFNLNDLGQIADSLLGAIEAKWNNTSALSTTMGELYLRTNPSGSDYPYATVAAPRAHPVMTTPQTRVDDHRIIFRVTATTPEEAEDLATVIQNTFAPIALDFRNGFSIPPFKTDKAPDKNRGKGPGNVPTYTHRVEFSCRVHTAS